MVRARASESVFHAIADPTRRKILDLLAERECGATEIAEPFRMSQPAVSQHLRILREAGLVRTEKVGRQRIYRLEPERLKEVYDWVAHYARFWREKLEALGELLDRMDDEPEDKRRPGGNADE